ncbi:MAG: hypothetical protein KJO41_00965 [Bacteroidia bacterium]|nr:hypothetical protein [Bacteroidia bacterium]MBT8277541.1 hypothetical protein [Bacteroidia bacterium]NND26623.1 hypothetical protein [Flavobacteriaceae bacterium]NNK60394.1 hypothetical protein [Flavobacteriaceae bacterium]
MVIKFQFYKETGLLVMKYSGSWSFQDYKDQFNMILKIPEFKQIKKVLSDVTEINLESCYKELDALVKFREQHVKSKYFNVHLISNSANTAIIHLYHQQLREKGFEYEYCSTLEQALTLLNLPYSAFEMGYMLEHLEHDVDSKNKSI